MIDEKKLVELCKELKEKETGTFSKGYNKALRDIISTVKSDSFPKMEWIPVSERLPNKDGYFLITTSDNEIDIREYLYSKGWGWDGFERVVAWMPLPEAYRKDGE